MIHHCTVWFIFCLHSFFRHTFGLFATALLVGKKRQNIADVQLLHRGSSDDCLSYKNPPSMRFPTDHSPANKWTQRTQINDYFVPFFYGTLTFLSPAAFPLWCVLSMHWHYKLYTSGPGCFWKKDCTYWKRRMAGTIRPDRNKVRLLWITKLCKYLLGLSSISLHLRRNPCATNCDFCIFNARRGCCYSTSRFIP